MNQDIARDEAQRDPPETIMYEVHGPRRYGGRPEAADDVAEERCRMSSKLSTATTQPLSVIKEDQENDDEEEEDKSIDRFIPLKPLLLTQPTRTDFDIEDDYSMDELYDEYNSQDDDWETASDLSEDNHIQHSRTTTSRNSNSDTAPLFSRHIDADSEEDEDIPSTPPNIIISRSPPLDITMRHPITHELSKREQYRKQTEQATSELSCAFVEQIEDVLCHEMQYLSLRGIPGQMHLDNHGPRQVSLYA